MSDELVSGKPAVMEWYKASEAILLANEKAVGDEEGEALLLLIQRSTLQ
jgi:hypothetical protein